MKDEKQHTIRKARLADVDAIKALADSNRRELGFVRRAALSESILRNEVFVAEVGTLVAAFVEYHHRKDSQTTLYHIAVAEEHRMQSIGRGLLQALEREAIACGKRRVVLKCPVELSANCFYQKLGFVVHSTQEGKKRPLNVWVLFPSEPADSVTGLDRSELVYLSSEKGTT